jgi:Probable lipoprotein LpqN
MKTLTRAGLIAVAAVTAGLVSGCGADSATPTPAKDATSATSEAAPTAAPPPVAGTPASQPNYTVADYIRDNGIQETPVHRGDPGIPVFDLPVPPYWQDLGARAPHEAWGGIVFTDPAAADNPPTILARMTRLTGNTDPAKILDYAKGELKNLPGFQGGDGKASTLGGFSAWQIGGTYTHDGVNRVIARKTVVIPQQDAVYVLDLNADGREDQLRPLMDATALIDQQATITPAR